MTKLLSLMPALNLIAGAVALCFLIMALLGGEVFAVVLALFGPLVFYGLLGAVVLRLFTRKSLPFIAEIAFICLSLLAAGLSLPLGNYFLLLHTLANLLVMVYSHMPDGGPLDL